MDVLGFHTQTPHARFKTMKQHWAKDELNKVHTSHLKDVSSWHFTPEFKWATLHCGIVMGEAYGNMVRNVSSWLKSTYPTVPYEVTREGEAGGSQQILLLLLN